MPYRRNDRFSYLGHPTDWTLMFIVLMVVMMVRVLAGCPEQWAVVVYSLTIRQRHKAGVQQQLQCWRNREGGVHQQEESSDKSCVVTGHQPFRLSQRSQPNSVSSESAKWLPTAPLTASQGAYGLVQGQNRTQPTTLLAVVSV